MPTESNEPTEQPVETPDAQDKPLVKGTGPDRGKTALGPLTGLLFALLGGALAWVLIQAFVPIATLSQDLFDDYGNAKSGMMEEFNAAVRSVGLRNRLFVCTVLGAMLGIALGAGEGVARRSPKTLVLAAVLGGLVSALFGAAAALAGHFIFLDRAALAERLSLASIMMIECTLWGILGGGLGLTLGVWTRRANSTVRCLIAGIAAGVLGGILFTVGVSVLTPREAMAGPVPLSVAARLLWIGISAALVGLIVPFAANQESAKDKALEPAGE